MKECEEQYRTASEAVALEDRRLQDLLHEMEFAATSKERSRVATKLSRSRKLRREQKDIMKRNEQVVEFFREQPARAILKRMNQLVGRQKTEEQYLDGKRTYKPRVEGGGNGKGA
ncbi:MAG: hypothetical protein ACLSAC_17535 [Enterocloster bolteae]